jgi:serine protease Do
MEIGDSGELRLGDVVLAIGNPFGIGQTVTMGIVSAKGRANVGIVDYEDFIQTDAAINPGNSGGALVNSEGQLVGINTAIVSRSGGYQGVGFAIPSNMARTVMKSLMEDGHVTRGYLGVVIQEVTGDLATALGLQSGEGVLVSDVAEDSPAEKAGLKRGDVIVRVGDQTVDSTGHLRNLVALSGSGRKVKISVLRDGKPKTFEVVLAEHAFAEGTSQLDDHYGVLGGLTVGPLDNANRQKFGVPGGLQEGVVVTEVAPGSAAARAGFRPGDVIREIDRESVGSVRELSELYDRAGDTVAVLIQRGGSTFYLALRKNG